MNVVLLDDVSDHNAQLKMVLERVFAREHIEANFALEATSLEEIMAYAATDPPQTVYFMDIRLEQEETGIDICRRLRRPNVRDRFIFVSAYPHYAMDCLKVHAYDLLLKPVSEAALEECVRSLRQEMLLDAEDVLDIRMGARTIRIPIRDIWYIASEGRNLQAHTARGLYTYAGSLSTLEEKLAPQGFVRVHRKYLVNESWIEEWTPTDVLVHGDKLPVSRRMCRQLPGGREGRV